MTDIRPGDPTWVELLTDSLSEAAEFYGPLFSWHFERPEQGPSGYRRISREGMPVGGMRERADAADAAGGQKAEGAATSPVREPAPPGWAVYLSTPDVRALVQRARAFGAQVVRDATDVPGAGSFATIEDRAGGTVGAWQPAAAGPWEALYRVGGPYWFELETPDFDRAVDFYRRVFAWEPVPMESEEGLRYVTHHAGERASAGLYDGTGSLPEGDPARWHVYFGVRDIDRAATLVRGLGGQVLEEPLDTAFGRLATVADTRGIAFHLAQGQPASAGDGTEDEGAGVQPAQAADARSDEDAAPSGE